jgi:dipeptidyl aminopeptidase/acylaminoacyl peptidase
MSFRAPLDGVMNVWVAPAGEFDKARPITEDHGRGIPVHFWALDSTHVMYLQDRDGDENWHIYSVNLKTDAVVDLSPYEATRANLVAQSEAYPGVAIIGMNDRDPRWHDTYRVDINTGERTLLLENDRYGNVWVDNDLQLRLAGESTPDGGLIVHQRGESGDWQELLRVGKEDVLSFSILGFNEANTGIYLLDSGGRDMAALKQLDLASGETEEIVAPGDVNVASVLIDPRNHRPVAYALNKHKQQWYALDPDFEENIAALNTAAGGADVMILATTLDASRWTVYLDGGNRSPVYNIFDRESNVLQELFVTNPGLEGLPLANVHDASIPSRDGKTLVSYLTLPTDSDPDGNGRPEAPVPLVLLVHGGPWARDTFGFSPQVQWLANRGYAVLQVNYRASSGFGKDFQNAGNGEWAGAMHDDLLDAKAWAVAEGITRKDQVAIMGTSYGGYATLVGLTFTPTEFTCGVDVVGPSNLATLIDSIPPYWESFRAQLTLAIGDPATEEGQALLKARSPLTFVDNIERPLLVGQGANDPRVKQAEADQIVDAMKAKEIPVTYVLYPDEGHGFQKPENDLSFYAVAEAFLAQCHGGRYQPIGDDFSNSSITVPTGAEHVPGLVEALDSL